MNVMAGFALLVLSGIDFALHQGVCSRATMVRNTFIS